MQEVRGVVQLTWFICCPLLPLSGVVMNFFDFVVWFYFLVGFFATPYFVMRLIAWAIDRYQKR